MQSYIV